MPMGTPVAVTPGARPPLGPGGTPVGKVAHRRIRTLRNISIYRIMYIKSQRQQVVRSSIVAVPTERVPLSAPGGPPERSGLAASVQMMPRSPSSPGVGRFLPATWGLSCICLCSAFNLGLCGLCRHAPTGSPISKTRSAQRQGGSGQSHRVPRRRWTTEQVRRRHASSRTQPLEELVNLARPFSAMLRIESELLCRPWS